MIIPDNKEVDFKVLEGMVRDVKETTQKIIELMKSDPMIAIEELAEKCGLTRDGINYNIRKLKNKGVIRRVGPDKGGHWEVIKKG